MMHIDLTITSATPDSGGITITGDWHGAIRNAADVRVSLACEAVWFRAVAVGTALVKARPGERWLYRWEPLK